MTRQLRKHLPQGEYILSHAREFLTPYVGTTTDDFLTAVAPWFTPNKWSGGGYLEVNRQVGYLIDWVRLECSVQDVLLINRLSITFKYAQLSLLEIY